MQGPTFYSSSASPFGLFGAQTPQESFALYNDVRALTSRVSSSSLSSTTSTYSSRSSYSTSSSYSPYNEPRSSPRKSSAFGRGIRKLLGAL